MTNEKFTRPLMYRIVITFHGDLPYSQEAQSGRITPAEKHSRGYRLAVLVGQSRRQPRASEQKRYKGSSINRDNILGEFSIGSFDKYLHVRVGRPRFRLGLEIWAGLQLILIIYNIY